MQTLYAYFFDCFHKHLSSVKSVMPYFIKDIETENDHTESQSKKTYLNVK